MKVKDVSIATFFAALYTVAVVVLAPISFGIFQVRLADALLPLSMLFGIPSALGVSLGCLVANVYGGLGIIDIVGGTIANLVACTLAWYIGGGKSLHYRFLGSLIETLTITVVVGGYLSLIFQFPLHIGLLGVFIGSGIAINGIGFTLEETLRQSAIIRKYGYT